MADIVLSEQELSVQVGDLNVIVVSYSHSAICGATNTHKSEGLDVFTAKSTSSNHESVDFQQLLLNLISIHSDLVVISASLRRSVDISIFLGKSLKNVVVEPLLKRGVFASELHNFLSNNTSEEGSHR